MTKLLDRAGVPDNILQLIPNICKTCETCRKFTRPMPTSITSADLADKFNQQVEADIMFVRKYQIFHMICRCTRWYEAWVIEGKSAKEIQDCFWEWTKRHGAPKELIMDQERAVDKSALTTELLFRAGTKYIPRGVAQHVSYIDRRTALQRDMINKIIDQCEKEGLEIDFKYVVAEATFASNALLSVNGSTPYNAVYGRTPDMLPGIEQNDADNEASLPRGGLIRHVHRLREISTQQMVEGSARERAKRALNTRSLPPGQTRQLRPGDAVDFYRQPNNKDSSGWIGPATVIDTTHMDRGTITIRHVHMPTECRLGDVRHHLPFLVFLAASHSNLSHHYLSRRDMLQTVEELGKGKIIVYGRPPTEKSQNRSNWVHFKSKPDAFQCKEF